MGLESQLTPSDETLITQAVELKDSDAFSELMRRYQSRILLLQRRLTGERALAEDMTQETFLRAWQKLHTFKGSGSFGGWLASLSYNVFLQFYRKNRRQKLETPLDDIEIADVKRDETALSDLDRLLAVLDPQDQAIMVLNYALGLSNTEVAQVVGMPAGTVKARIHRAKQKIQQHLERGDGSTPSGSASAGVDQQDSGRSAAGTERRDSQPAGIFGQLTGAYRA